MKKFAICFSKIFKDLRTENRGKLSRKISKGHCPDCAHARASYVSSSKDNKHVILTRQDFFPDRTAYGDLLFTFSSNILDFRRSFSSYLKFGSRHEDSSRFCCWQGRLATRKSRSARFKNSFSIVKLQDILNSHQNRPKTKLVRGREGDNKREVWQIWGTNMQFSM